MNKENNFNNKDNKTLRFLDLYNELLLKGFINIESYKKNHNIDKRTLQRYISDLKNKYNIEITFNEGFYQINSNNLKKWKEEIPRSIFKDIKRNDEQIINDIIKKICFNIKYFKDHDIKSENLLNDSKNNLSDILFVSKYPVLNNISNSNNLSMLIDCIKKNNTIEFKYDKFLTAGIKSNKIKSIPLILFYYQNRLYLFAIDCNNNNIIKKYNIDFISDIKILHNKLRIKKEIDKLNSSAKHNEYFDKERKKILLSLEKKGNILHSNPVKNTSKTEIIIYKEKAYMFKKYNFGFGQKIKDNDDGSITVNFNFSDETEMWFALCSWIPFMKIVKPLMFREYFKEIINNFIKKNKS